MLDWERAAAERRDDNKAHKYGAMVAVVATPLSRRAGPEPAAAERRDYNKVVRGTTTRRKHVGSRFHKAIDMPRRKNIPFTMNWWCAITKPSGDQRQWRVRMLLLHGAMFIAPAALLLLHGRCHADALGGCVVRSLCGVDCPACGVTRSAMALLSGRVGDSFRIHPAGPMIICILGLMVAYLSFVLLTGRSGMEWRAEAKAYRSLDRLTVGVLVAGWVGRMMAN